MIEKIAFKIYDTICDVAPYVGIAIVLALCLCGASVAEMLV